MVGSKEPTLYIASIPLRNPSSHFIPTGHSIRFQIKFTGVIFMAFRSGQNYFKSTSNSQTLYQHVITLNIMLKISR